MEKITKCLNEWNAIIEALGSGKQSILIRKSGTTLPGFLLYPTITYTNNENFLDGFKPDFKKFAETNALPEQDGNKRNVKYYAEVVEVLEKPYSRIGSLKKYHIWTNEHVKSYLANKNAKVWLLRIYELQKPVMTEKTRSITYANVLDEISLEGMKPVISDKEFKELSEKIKK